MVRVTGLDRNDCFVEETIGVPPPHDPHEIMDCIERALKEADLLRTTEPVSA